MNRIIWITGAAGFIGGAATRYFSENGWRVIGFDRQRPEATLPSTAFHVAPIEDWILEAALKAHGKPDVVFHAAGTGTVGQAQANPEKSRRDTVGTTTAILNTLGREAPGTRILYPSSAAVYGNAGGSAALAEDRALSPASVYGQDKQEVERLCTLAGQEGRLSIGVVRFFSVYGPGLRKQLPWDLGKKLLTQTAGATLFGTGQETRDFLNIADAIQLIAHLATHTFTGTRIVNGGTGLATTIADFAGMMATALGQSTPIAFSGETKAGDPTHMRADTTKLHALGFQPRVTLGPGLQEYADWIKAETLAEAKP
ncbi:MAG: NAD(P)-dependent oxidoreductase [Rhodospirillaceae bacterium]|nr:NAD(P)-dependent oxidoreductase [Rhodospirillaceae bacterium]